MLVIGHAQLQDIMVLNYMVVEALGKHIHQCLERLRELPQSFTLDGQVEALARYGKEHLTKGQVLQVYIGDGDMQLSIQQAY